MDSSLGFFIEGIMRFLGQREGPTKCYCLYCIGGRPSKPHRRTLKKRGRQHQKKDIEKEMKKLSEPVSGLDT